MLFNLHSKIKFKFKSETSLYEFVKVFFNLFFYFLIIHFKTIIKYI